MARKTKQDQPDPSDSSATPRATTPEPSSDANTQEPSSDINDPATPPATSEELSSRIEWIRKVSKFKPFDLRAANENNVHAVAEFQIKGTVASTFLRSTPNKFSHTLVLNIDPAEVDKVKELVKTCPAFVPEEDFRWPFTGTEAKFTSRSNLNGDFINTWDGRKMSDIQNVTERNKLPAQQIEVGSNVVVEYTIVPYLGRKATDKDEGFSAGCSLELLSVGLLSDDEGNKHGGIRFDFDSPNKKRRTR